MLEVRAVNSAGEGAVAERSTRRRTAPPHRRWCRTSARPSPDPPYWEPSLIYPRDSRPATTAGTLDSIDLKLAAPNDGTTHPTVTLHKDSPTSTAIATLTAPSRTIAATAANYKYTAPSNTTLIAATTYYVVLEGSDALPRWNTTSDNDLAVTTVPVNIVVARAYAALNSAVLSPGSTRLSR